MIATVAAPVAREVARFFAATLQPVAHTPSRLESILWWLPALSFVTLGLAIAVELGQSMPRGSRWHRIATRFVWRIAALAGLVIVLNVIRAADIVGVF